MRSKKMQEHLPEALPAKRLAALFRKKEKLICGVMSGTSLDGIDVAIVRVSGCGTSTTFSSEAFDTIPYSDAVRQGLLAIQSSQSLDDVARGNIALGFVFADAIKAVCANHNIPLQLVDVIGLHGQTIWHAPEKKEIFGKLANGTLQIGDPSAVAKQCGVITIGDFRVADCSVSGEGAPLMPYIDYILFQSNEESRALLNIGGIANLALLPKGCTINDVLGFDTGPGNMLIDALCQRYFNCKYDKDGAIAKSGKVNEALLTKLMDTPFIRRTPPKSTGRETFGKQFIEEVCSDADRLPITPTDLLTTISIFTAKSISHNFNETVKNKNIHLNELIVSGGGAHNQFLISAIEQFINEQQGLDVRVVKSDKYGINVDAKEAIGFALLANEMINEVPANVPKATGASTQTILGKLAL